MDDDGGEIRGSAMDEEQTIVDPNLLPDDDATIFDPRLLQPQDRSRITSLIPVVDPEATIADPRLLAQLAAPVQQNRSRVTSLIPALDPEATIADPRLLTPVQQVAPVQQPTKKKRVIQEISTSAPVATPSAATPEIDTSGLQSKPELYADTYVLAMFFLNDTRRMEYPDAQKYVSKVVWPAIERNVPPYADQVALRNIVKEKVSTIYKVEDQNTIDEMIMDVLERSDYIAKALNFNAFEDPGFYYDVAMHMRDLSLPAQYLAVTVSKIDQYKNFKRSEAAKRALLDMRKVAAVTEKKARRLQAENVAWEAEHRLLAQQSAAEIRARDVALAQTAAQLQQEQNTAAQLAANLQQQAANTETALQQKDQQIAIEQQRTGIVSQAAQMQAAALEADKQRLQQEAAEASARAQAIASQADQLLQIKDASIAEKEAAINQLRVEFNARLMEETAKSTELATRLNSELDATKARELELSKQLAEKAAEMTALAASKAVIQSKKEKAKKVKKELEELQTDDLFSGIVVPSVDPNEERMKQKEAEIAAKESYLQQALDKLNAEAAEVHAKMKKQQETADLQKEWVDIARDLRVKMEEEHAAELAKLTAELDVLKAKCATAPPAPSAPPAPAAAPTVPPAPAAPPAAVAAAPQPTPAQPAAVAAQAPTELQKAQAIADAHWDKHPRAKARDLKYKNQKVVTTAAEYDPRRNDFPGVDLGTKRFVRWK